MRKFLFTLLILTVTILQGFSQVPNKLLYDPFKRSLRPTYHDSLPEFVKMTLLPNPNMLEVAEAFEEYEKEHAEEEDRKVGETEVENPFDVYYHRWQKAYAPFMQEDGSIKLPEYAPFQKQLQAENTACNAAVINQPPKPEGVTANWTCVGPKETFWLKDDNAAQPACPWQANILAFDVSKSNNSILYVGTETRAVFKTTDKGLNWTICASGFNFGGTPEAIAVHPTNPNTVFLGAGDNIYKTTDGGDTWTSIYSTVGLSPNAIVVSSADPNLILVAADAGFFRTTNGGTSWTQVYTDICYDVEINPVTTTQVFILKDNAAKTNVEFLKSTNSGSSFTVKSTGLTNATAGRLAVTANDGNRVYALLTTGSGSKLMKSTNAGEAWATTTVTFCTGGISDATGGQGFYDLSIAASPTNADQVIFGFSSLHKSTDGGATSSFVGGYCGTFAVHPDLQEVRAIGSDVWVATDGGMTLSTDFFTTNSEARNNGIYATEFWGFGQGWNEDIMVGGRYHNGNTAMADFYPSGKALRMGGGEAGTGYVLPGQTRAAVFSDLGNGWILPDIFDNVSGGRFSFTKYPNEDSYGANSSPMVADPRYAKHLYLGEGTTLWKTTDGGATFNALHDFGSPVRRYDVSRSNPSLIYLTTDAGFYKSTDGGTNWTTLTMPIGRTANFMRFSLSATNDNLLWAVFENISGSLLGKVYSSADGGTTWTDKTTNALNGYVIKWVQMAQNTEGGVYVAATNNQGRVFYIDNNQSNWVNFSTNLPATMDIIRLLPFYRDAKLRVAGNRGVWETLLYNESFAPIAQPMVDKKTSNCGRDTFFFDDYSIVKHAGTTWSWSFSPTPQYVSNANSRNPKVIFGSTGDFTATLTVTNANGTNSKTITNMVSIPVDECNPDVVAGKSLSLTTTSDYFLTPSVDLGTTNTVTLMAWVRPTGIQTSYAGILSCSTGVVVNLNVRANNELGMHWNDLYFNFASGLTLPADRWSHIALVATGTNLTLYLNGKPAANAVAPAAVDLSNRQWYVGCDRGYTYRAFNGMIDEVAFYNRSLTQNEIREQMHLTKLSSETALKGYFQFNETSGNVNNRVAVGSGVLAGSATRATSTAPVGTGTSERQMVTTAGVKTFTTAGVTLTFPSSGTLPNGELCVTRLHNAPDQLPNAYPNAAKNWIINNYGTNATFAALTGMSLTGYGNINGSDAATPSAFKVYKRGTGQDAATWGTSVGFGTSASSGTDGIIAFNPSGVTSFSQFTVVRENAVLPLVLSDFTAQKVEKNHAQLNWTTEQEANTAYFDVERSNDGSRFEKIGTVKSAGTSTDKRVYTFADNEELTGVVYYRLRMVDNDGHFTFSNIQSLDFDKAVAVLIYPNPISTGKMLTFKTNIEGEFDITITDISGKRVLKKTFSTPEVSLNTEGVAKGVYLYALKSKTYWAFGKIVVD